MKLKSFKTSMISATVSAVALVGICHPLPSAPPLSSPAYLLSGTSPTFLSSPLSGTSLSSHSSLSSLFAIEASARKVGVRLKPSKRTLATAADSARRAQHLQQILADSVVQRLRLSGYDKTATADMESLFVTNHSTHRITLLKLQLNYFDMKDRQLHQRDVTLRVDLPAGQTRRVDFRTWDRQHAFHYHLSPPSRRATSPYKITVKILHAE